MLSKSNLDKNYKATKREILFANLPPVLQVVWMILEHGSLIALVIEFTNLKTVKQEIIVSRKRI